MSGGAEGRYRPGRGGLLQFALRRLWPARRKYADDRHHSLRFEFRRLETRQPEADANKEGPADLVDGGRGLSKDRGDRGQNAGGLFYGNYDETAEPHDGLGRGPLQTAGSAS